MAKQVYDVGCVRAAVGAIAIIAILGPEPLAAAIKLDTATNVERVAPRSGTPFDPLTSGFPDADTLTTTMPVAVQSFSTSFFAVNGDAYAVAQDGVLKANGKLDTRVGFPFNADMLRAIGEGASDELAARTAFSRAQTSFQFIAPQSASFDANIVFRHTLEAPAATNASFGTQVGAALATDPLYSGASSFSILAGQTYATTSFQLQLQALDAGGFATAPYSVWTLSTTMLLDHRYSFGANGAFSGASYTRSNRRNGAFSFYPDLAAPPTVLTLTSQTLDSTLARIETNQFASQSLSVVAGTAYSFILSLTCQVSIWGLAAFDVASGGQCLADRSLYWDGIGNAVDPNGRPLADFSLISPTGLDYRYSSPLLDTPSNPAPTVDPIPEPASWALLIAGFLASGAALRARQRAAA
jgi:hypothetical protein